MCLMIYKQEPQGARRSPHQLSHTHNYHSGRWLHIPFVPYLSYSWPWGPYPLSPLRAHSYHLNHCPLIDHKYDFYKVFIKLDQAFCKRGKNNLFSLEVPPPQILSPYWRSRGPLQELSSTTLICHYLRCQHINQCDFSSKSGDIWNLHSMAPWGHLPPPQKKNGHSLPISMIPTKIR